MRWVFPSHKNQTRWRTYQQCKRGNEVVLLISLACLEGTDNLCSPRMSGGLKVIFEWLHCFGCCKKNYSVQFWTGGQSGLRQEDRDCEGWRQKAWLLAMMSFFYSCWSCRNCRSTSWTLSTHRIDMPLVERRYPSSGKEASCWYCCCDIKWHAPFLWKGEIGNSNPTIWLGNDFEV